MREKPAKKGGKMAKWLAIGVLFFMLISYSIVNTLTMFKLQRQVDQVQVHKSIAELQNRVDKLYKYKEHFIRRLNIIEYPEVLGKKKGE